MKKVLIAASAAINSAREGRIYCPLTNTSEFKEVTYSQL